MAFYDHVAFNSKGVLDLECMKLGKIRQDGVAIRTDMICFQLLNDVSLWALKDVDYE